MSSRNRQSFSIIFNQLWGNSHRRWRELWYPYNKIPDTRSQPLHFVLAVTPYPTLRLVRLIGMIYLGFRSKQGGAG